MEERKEMEERDMKGVGNNKSQGRKEDNLSRCSNVSFSCSNFRIFCCRRFLLCVTRVSSSCKLLMSVADSLEDRAIRSYKHIS
jgi:hypothetical protein